MAKRPTVAHPACENCDHYRKPDGDHEHTCQKHTFVMPYLDWHTLCRDWQHQQQTHESVKLLSRQRLYYYSYDAGLQAEVGHFQELTYRRLSVSVRQDRDLGWVIFPRSYQRFFPAPDTFVNVLVGDRLRKFQVVNAERNIAVEMIPRRDGEWDVQYHTQQVFMLYSVESPDLLYDWMQTFMDVDAYIRQSFHPSLFAFVDVMQQTGEYTLRPDMLVYQQYLR